MMKENYNEIVVVEGEHDKARLLSIYPDLEVIITNGSEVSQQTIDLLKELSKTNKIILFLDPDYPGERIRHILENNIDNIAHAFLDKKKAISHNRKKVGIEHAEKEDIINSLNNLLTNKNEIGSLKMNDLYELGLVGLASSKEKRELLATKYPIGHTNGKTLLKRLNYLNITKKELEDILYG